MTRKEGVQNEKVCIKKTCREVDPKSQPVKLKCPKEEDDWLFDIFGSRGIPIQHLKQKNPEATRGSHLKSNFVPRFFHKKISYQIIYWLHLYIII